MSKTALSDNGSRITAFAVYGGAALLAVLVFMPWVQGYLMGDDWMHFARNVGTALPEELRQISDGSNSRFYRPLFEWSNAIIWQVFGWDFTAHQLISFALHGLNTALISRLAYRLSKQRLLALFAGLIFAVLCSHTEAVMWLGTRHELVVGGLALAAMLCYIAFRSGRGWGWAACTVAAYLVSLGFKETALALPVLLGVYEVLFVLPARNRIASVRRDWRSYLPLFVLVMVSLGYGAFRAMVGGGYAIPFSLYAVAKNLVYYILMQLIGLPVSTSLITAFPFISIPVMLVLALSVASALWIGRRALIHDRTFYFGIAWLVIALAPVILIITERTTYVSSIGAALAIGTIMTRCWGSLMQSSKSLLRMLVAVVLVTAILGANIAALSHRSYWWHRSGEISRGFIVQVQESARAVPPDKPVHLWFVDLPLGIQYAHAFGNRTLFAVWLLDDPRLRASLLEQPTGVTPLAEQMAQRRESLGITEAVFVFYWSGENVQKITLPPAQP